MGEHSGWGLKIGSPGSAGAAAGGGSLQRGYFSPEPAGSLGSAGAGSGPVDGGFLELTDSGSSAAAAAAAAAAG